MHGVIMTGRKRHSGNREANGRIQREKDVDTRIVASVMPHRRDLPARYQDDSRAESPFGRLLLSGKITPQQYGAGIRYRNIVIRYRAVMSIPSHSPPSMAGILLGKVGGGRGLTQDDIADRRDAYNAAFEYLDEHGGHRCCVAVKTIAIYEREHEHVDIQVLKCGLNVLIAHFELTNRANRFHVRNIQ